MWMYGLHNAQTHHRHINTHDEKPQKFYLPFPSHSSNKSSKESTYIHNLEMLMIPPPYDHPGLSHSLRSLAQSLSFLPVV